MLELFQRTQTTTSTTHPHSNTLHSTAMMSPVPTPLMGFSSLKPQGQEWTHRPIFNYLPEQDQRVAETMFSKIFGERNSTKTSKYYF